MSVLYTVQLNRIIEKHTARRSVLSIDDRCRTSIKTEIFALNRTILLLCASEQLISQVHLCVIVCGCLKSEI